MYLSSTDMARWVENVPAIGAMYDYDESSSSRPKRCWFQAHSRVWIALMISQKNRRSQPYAGARNDGLGVLVNLSPATTKSDRSANSTPFESGTHCHTNGQAC